MKTFLKKVSVKIILFSGLFSGLCLLSVQALAVVEARLTYGLNATKMDLAQFYTGSTASVPSVTPLYGIGGEILFNIPMMGWGLGLRYENLGLKASSNGLEFNSTLTRTAAVGYYRLIDTVLFLGPIASIGLSHKGELKVKENSVDLSSFSSSSASSTSIGLEAGIRVVGLVVGMEAGYLTCKFSGVNDSGVAALGSKDLDMSGTYAKVFVGFSM